MSATTCLDTILREGAEASRQITGFVPLVSSLHEYSPEQWREFCGINGFEAASEGLYVPSSHRAYVLSGTEAFIPNVLHEYFGHGVFTEHSSIGKGIAEAKDQRAYLLDPAQAASQRSGVAWSNWANYEGFATWLEKRLCLANGHGREWDLKSARLPPPYTAALDVVENAESQLTTFGLLAQMGFPKVYDGATVLNTLKRMYGPAFGGVDAVVLYGSRRPTSDIDLFIVGDRSFTMHNGWLDVYALHRDEFARRCSLFDVSVTDPLFSGELIYGDPGWLLSRRIALQTQPITPEAIAHNLSCADDQLRQAMNATDDASRRIGVGYARTYSAMAEGLSRGNPSFVRDALWRGSVR